MPSTLNREESERWQAIEPLLPAYAIGPDKPSWAYRLGLVGVVLGLLLVVVAYAGLVLAIAGFVAYVAFHPPSGSGFLPWFYYGAIVSLSLLVLFFLVKPLFARRRGGESLLRIERDEHPLLDLFISRIAKYADVPPPRAVFVDCSVNASASFNRGLKGWWSNEYRLVLGLPLVAGLDLRAFGGVLAHEMGHFAQFHAMRLTYVIRHLNHWLFLVVHDRDQWDRELAELAFHRRGIRTLLAWPAFIVVSLFRGLLWLVMAAAHGVSCFALRQMEYGADRYEIAFAGREGFRGTTRRLTQLGAGFVEARRLLRDSWKDRRLPHDFAQLARVQADRLSPEAVELAKRLMQKEQGSVFFTHPSDHSRLRKARSRPWEPGIPPLGEPASVLFRDFAKLSQRATLAFYRSEFGQEEVDSHLVEIPVVLKDGRRRRQEVEAVERFLGGLWRVLPRVQLGRNEVAEGSCGRTRSDLDRKWVADRELSEGRIVALREAKARHLDAVRAYEIFMAGGRVDRRRFGRAASDPWKLHALADGRRRAHREAIVNLRQFSRSTRERLVYGLQVAIEGGTFLSREVERFVEAMEFFAVIDGDWFELEELLSAMNALVGMIQKARLSSELVQRLQYRAMQADRVRERILKAGAQFQNPLRRGKGRTSIEAALLAVDGESDDSGLRSYEMAAGTDEALWDLYERVLGRLVLLSETV